MPVTLTADIIVLNKHTLNSEYIYIYIYLTSVIKDKSGILEGVS